MINTRNNIFLYPIDRLLYKTVEFLFGIAGAILPPKISAKLQKYKANSTLYNVIGLSIFNALGGLLLMFTNVKLANVLGAAVFGLYSYYLAIGEVGANFVRYGRHKTMVRDLIQKPKKRDSLIAHTFVLGCLNLLIYIVIILLFHKPLDVDLTLTCLLLCISPCLISVDFQPVYESLRLMSWHSIYYLIQKFIFLSLLWCTLIIWGKITLAKISVYLFISWIFILLVQYQEIISELNIKIFSNIKLANLWALYKENFLIALSCMFGVAFGPLIRLVLKNYVDASAVGIYAAGMQIYILSQFLMHQVGRVGNPTMAEAGKSDCGIDKRRRLVKQYVFIMLIASIPFAVPMFIIPKTIVSLFFTAEYAQLSSYLPILGIYLIAISIGVVFTQFLISMRQDKTYFMLYASASIATILFAFMLIPLYGVLGAYLTLCLPHSFVCILYFVFSIKYLR